VTAEATGVKLSYSYPKPGSYLATLVVTDNHGLEDADTVTVTVGPALPPLPSDARIEAAPGLDRSGDGTAASDRDRSRVREVAAGDSSPTTAPPEPAGCSCELETAGTPPCPALALLLVLLVFARRRA
jgi:MYXO-CTERM domain-containing protein